MIQNGLLQYSTGSLVGDTASYMCNPGFSFSSGDGHIQCKDDCTWEKTPSCFGKGCAVTMMIQYMTS